MCKGYRRLTCEGYNMIEAVLFVYFTTWLSFDNNGWYYNE